MCNIFASQNPDDYVFMTRSVRLAGHATSIRLEARFWEIVDQIAAHQGMSTPRFLSTLYEEALQAQGEIPNFASLLRTSCLIYLQRPHEVPGKAELAHAGENAV